MLRESFLASLSALGAAPLVKVNSKNEVWFHYGTVSYNNVGDTKGYGENYFYRYLKNVAINLDTKIAQVNNPEASYLSHSFKSPNTKPVELFSTVNFFRLSTKIENLHVYLHEVSVINLNPLQFRYEEGAIKFSPAEYWFCQHGAMLKTFELHQLAEAKRYALNPPSCPKCSGLTSVV